MEKKKLIEYWVETAELDFDAAQQLLKSQKYPHALFFGHLSIEKMLKALYVNIKEDYPPKTHNLILLIKSIGVDVSKEVERQLIEINSFNMEARYPDEKFEFYKKCTPDFTQQYFKIIEEVKNWLKKRL